MKSFNLTSLIIAKYTKIITINVGLNTDRVKAKSASHISLCDKVNTFRHI